MFIDFKGRFLFLFGDINFFMSFRLISNSRSSCLSLLSVGITGLSQYTQLENLSGDVKMDSRCVIRAMETLSYLSLKGTKNVAGRCIEQGARRTDPGHQWAEDSWGKGKVEHLADEEGLNQEKESVS